MRTLTYDEKHLPDVDWCLRALSALDPIHMIFDPDYEPPFSQRGRRGNKYIPTAEDLLFLDKPQKILSKMSKSRKLKTKMQKLLLNIEIKIQDNRKLIRILKSEIFY